MPPLVNQPRLPPFAFDPASSELARARAAKSAPGARACSASFFARASAAFLSASLASAATCTRMCETERCSEVEYFAACSSYSFRNAASSATGIGSVLASTSTYSRRTVSGLRYSREWDSYHAWICAGVTGAVSTAAGGITTKLISRRSPSRRMIRSSSMSVTKPERANRLGINPYCRLSRTVCSNVRGVCGGFCEASSSW